MRDKEDLKKELAGIGPLLGRLKERPSGYRVPEGYFEALAAALESGKLFGAGLDVYNNEPPEAANALLSLPQVISAPHMAGVTWEAWNRMAYTAVRNVIEVLDGKPNHEHTVNPQVYGAKAA